MDAENKVIKHISLKELQNLIQQAVRECKS